MIGYKHEFRACPEGGSGRAFHEGERSLSSMEDTARSSILGLSFRANPRYELILFDRLSEDQKQLLGDLQKEAEFYGILRPREASGLSIKSVDRDTALLFLSLQEPGGLPGYVLRMYGAGSNAAITQLVLDSVLEVDGGEGFRTGAGAWGLVSTGEEPPEGDGMIARLSLEALRYGQELPITDIQQLSARLYFYNRAPLSPRWKKELPGREAVLRYLGIDGGGANRRALEEHWCEVKPAPPYDSGWLYWQRRHPRVATARGRHGHKLYVSPVCESLPAALPAVIEALSRSSATQFKMGSDAGGLLRPDKIVAYFGTLEEVMEAAHWLAERLRGCPAQGVPFTGQITGDGLMSRGADPPAEEQPLDWMQRESWRLWVTNRLATALLAARVAEGAVVEPWRFALQRIRLEGVDTENWTPSDRLWRQEEQGEE